MTSDLMSLPEFPAGFLKTGLYCVRCGKKQVTLRSVECRAFRVGNVEEWLPFVLHVCDECLAEFHRQVTK